MHFIKEVVAKTLLVWYVLTEFHILNIFPKPMSTTRFETLRAKLIMTFS